MQLFSISMRYLTALFFLHSKFLRTASAIYTLQIDYSGSNFFDGFNFYTEADPTHGFVNYVDQATARSTGLISASDGAPVYIGVDSTNVYDGNIEYYGVDGVGRPSIRIESKANYNHGLIIADILNMPGGVCGTWPALWTLGDGTWPYHGEIDIVEGVNVEDRVLSSLHTVATCTVPDLAAQMAGTGVVQSTDCAYDPSNGGNRVGCTVRDQEYASFGIPFNNASGGIYAMEWTSAAIKVWFFPRSAIPDDITAGTPDPTRWINPYANFAGNCDIDSSFVNHRIVLDATFCGDWASTVWDQSCSASTRERSCSVYVGSNPSAFRDMYWSINSIKVYQNLATNSSATPDANANATSYPTSDGGPTATHTWGDWHGSSVPTVSNYIRPMLYTGSSTTISTPSMYLSVIVSILVMVLTSFLRRSSSDCQPHPVPKQDSRHRGGIFDGRPSTMQQSPLIEPNGAQNTPQSAKFSSTVFTISRLPTCQ